MNLYWRRTIAVLEMLGGLVGILIAGLDIVNNWGNWAWQPVFVFYLALFTLYGWAGIGLWRGTRYGHKLSIIYQSLQAVYFKLAFFQFIFSGGFFAGIDIHATTFGFRFAFLNPTLSVTIGHTGLTPEWGINFLTLVFLFMLTLPENKPTTVVQEPTPPNL